MDRQGWCWRWCRFLPLTAAALLIAGTAFAPSPAVPQLEEELRATETAFANTMADRDPDAFARFLSDEAVFFGGDTVHRGKEAVVESWSVYFSGPDAPFSWRPDAVAVLESGRLGLTSGPVFDPAGKRIGTFNSVWRRGPDNKWKIVFDRGCPPCNDR